MEMKKRYIKMPDELWQKLSNKTDELSAKNNVFISNADVVRYLIKKFLEEETSGE